MTTEINNIPDINKYEIEGLERKTNVSALALGIVACVVGIALFIIQKMSANTLLAYAMIFVGIVMVCYGAFQIIWQSKNGFTRRPIPSHAATIIIMVPMILQV